MIPRLVAPLMTNSFFLFGARGTGKTYFLDRYLPEERTLKVNLLSSSEFDDLSVYPDALSDRIAGFRGPLEFVFIDEIQKIPRLLDVVHDLIEQKQMKFALSGSSARKLKRGGANLLAGRAFQYYLYPLISAELQDQFSLSEALNWGTLPKLLELNTDVEKETYLRTYIDTYLKEEILQEQLIRNLVPFKRFLDVAAQSSGKRINYSAIARDILSNDKTVRSYFQILEDTLLGQFIEPFHLSIRKRQKQSPKFYFFDIGVKRAITKTLTLPLREGTYAYGDAFEHLVVNEISARIRYLKPDYQLSYLTTDDDAEIDLVIERPGLPTLLVEIKSKRSVSVSDLRHLTRLGKDIPGAIQYCFTRDSIPKKIDGVECLPWQIGIEEIGW